MLSFLAGLIIGAAATVAIATGIIFRASTAAIAIATANNISDTAEKLVKARKRFGQIANRESIGEARKIANTAIKELEK